MATLALFYRDGDNYKSAWDAEVPEQVARNLPEPDEDGLVDIRKLGLKVSDIPLVAKYGFDQQSDHPFVTVESVTFDDGTKQEFEYDV